QTLQQGQLRYINSGNSLSLAVAKYSSSENFITSSGNALKYFIPNIIFPVLRKGFMLKALISNKEKLLDMENKPLNENCSSVILKKLHKKLRDPSKFLIPCGFSELKCKAIADLAGIARDVFIPVGKFTFLANFVIGEKMILCDGDERLTLNMRDDTSSYSNQPHRESINTIDIYNDSYEDYLEDLIATNHLMAIPLLLLLTICSRISSMNSLLLHPPGNDDLLFHIESDPREIEYLLNHNPTKEIDSILKDSVNEGNLVDPNNDLVDTIPEMFTDEYSLDYSSPPLYDDVDDDLIELESDNDDVYDDPFDSKEDKIKESKLLIDELDPPRSSNFLPSPECDSVLYEDFSKVDALPLTNNEGKVFNPGIIIHENHFEVTI
nr:reverse transcriptase domain-containing protein [Tanacetum cinerariifolium]